MLLFAASEAKFRQFVERIVGEDNSVYIYYAYRVDPKLTKEVLEMAGRRNSYRKNLEFIANDIGKEIVQFLSPEYRVRGLTPEERLRGLNPEDILCGIDAETQEEIKKLLSNQAKKKNQE